MHRVSLNKIGMNKLLYSLVILILCACGNGDKKTTVPAGDRDPALEKRLAEFMKINDEMDLEKVIDYTYPKLFEFVSREDLLKTIREGFKNEQLEIQLDSLKVDTLFPIFTVGDARYAKIKYSMIMLMKLKKESEDTSHLSGNELMIQMLREKYGPGNFSVDDANNTVRIRMQSPMVAVKDSFAKEWSFVNLVDKDPFVDKLFTREVQDKLATYN
jgi:hypothetical protein